MEGKYRNTLVLIAVIIIAVGVYVTTRSNETTILEVPGNFSMVQEENTPHEPEPTESETPSEGYHEKEVDAVYKTDTLSVPAYAPSGVNHPPWEGSIYLASSDDGLTFNNERFFVQHAGVPNLLLSENRIIATFQYFSYTDEALFDRIAYTVSEDSGITWSPIRPVKLEARYSKGSTPVDPTLVQLPEGRFRLYFTYHEPGNQYASLYSSSSTTIDGVFEDEGMQLSTDSMLLDPAVVYYEDTWHHYTVNHGGSGTLHSTSSDGLDFTLQEPIQSDYQFLGDAIVDNGKIRFYGTGRGVVLAESTNGYTFTKVKEQVADGADPGVVKLPNGSYLIVYKK